MKTRVNELVIDFCMSNERQPSVDIDMLKLSWKVYYLVPWLHGNHKMFLVLSSVYVKCYDICTERCIWMPIGLGPMNKTTARRQFHGKSDISILKHTTNEKLQVMKLDYLN